MAITLVVFDLIGTTVLDGGAVARAMYQALDAAGLTLRDGASSGVAGLAKMHAIRTLIEGHGRNELLGEVDAIHADFDARMQAVYRSSPAVRAVPGARETFAALRAAGVRVAIDTGFSRAMLDLVLNRVGWSTPGDPLDATVATDEVARGRPYPDMIDALRANFGNLPAAEVAKVGDTPNDLLEGTMARCGLVVGVSSGGHDSAALAEHPHDALLTSVAELPALLAARGLLPRHG